MAENHLPEDIIVKILHRVPLKPLMRFSTVSKRWHFIICADPQFAKSYLKTASEQQTRGRRLLISTVPHVESLDLETPSFGDNSSVTKLCCPFKKPGCRVKLLGSCNGFVCVALASHKNFYIWNPTNGFFQKLPDPDFSGAVIGIFYSGFGHLSATDDYKVIVAAGIVRWRYAWRFQLEEEEQVMIMIFSLRSKLWKKIKNPLHHYNNINRQGALLNETLHWMNEEGPVDIVAFDLAEEDFRRMPLPDDLITVGIFSHLGVSSAGCLYVTRCYSIFAADYYVDLWVMREYGARDSWTKLFNFKICEPPLDMYRYTSSTVVMESSTGFLVLWGMSGRDNMVVLKIDHKEGILGQYMLLESGAFDMIEYEENLLWIRDYHDRGGREEGQKAQNQSQGDKGALQCTVS